MRKPAVASFDFGGTLDGRGIAPKELRWELYRQAGHTFSRETLSLAHRQTRERLAQMNSSRNWGIAETTRHWFEIETQILGFTDSQMEKWISESASRKRRDLERCKPVLRRMKSEYHLAVVTNNIGNLPIVFAEVSMSDIFEVVVDSADCGFRKPDPRIFLTCAAHFPDLMPDQFWHIGDSFERDVKGAIGVGWNAVWLTNGKQDREGGADCHVVRTLPEFEALLKNHAAG